MDPQKPGEDSLKEEKKPIRFSISHLLTAFLLALVIYRIFTGLNPGPQEIPYSEFKTTLDGRADRQRARQRNQHISGKLRDGTDFTTVRVEDPELTKRWKLKGRDPRAGGKHGGGIIGFLVVLDLPGVIDGWPVVLAHKAK
jgi:hypothetical protein